MVEAKQKAIFLDRDGVITEIVFHSELGIFDSPLNPNELKLISGIEKPLHLLKAAGYVLVVVSNQPILAKKKTSKLLFNAMHKKFILKSRLKGIKWDGIYYCMHHPKAEAKNYRQVCNCRKPKAGLLKKAAIALNISLKKSYVIGDSWSDVAAGNTVQCKTIFLTDQYKSELVKLLAEKKVKPCYYAKSLNEVADIILNGKR